MKTLIVIDMQNDFVTGALGSKEAVAILPNVKKKIEEYVAAGDEVIFTRDTHGELKPFTRDTFSSCIKATYCEIDGKPTPIFKNPKDGGFKKSQKGCCVVYEEEIRLLDESYAGTEIHYKDEFTWDEACNDPRNMLKTVFKDGAMTKAYTLAEVRANLHGGNF